MSRRTTILMVLFSALGASPALHAQYKVVGSDGTVTYTDRPPVTGNARVEEMRLNQRGPGPVSSLPYALQLPVSRFPVTLYTMPNCTQCDRGREYLRQRGIPYTEMKVESERDREAWSALNYGTEVPVLKLGQQVLRNFAQEQWAADLTLAGYPATSALPPSGYSGWQAAPLGGSPPPAPQPTRRADAPAQLPPILESAPNGIRF
jgi:glutaredoxin